MSSTSDVLIVTVTEVESRAVMKVFREATGKDSKPELIGDRIYLDLGEVSGGRIFMALSGMGTGGVSGSQEGVRKGIEALSPTAVIMVGIAFGINEQKQAIGDILVSERLMLYDLQRVGTDTEGKIEIIPRGDRPHASPWLINQFQVANLSWEEARGKIRTGLILSGDKLADNMDFRAQLLRFEPEAIGGEMEGAGLYVASQNSKVDWILVKGICDWADGRKATDKQARQQLAAHNAAAFVLHALQQAPIKHDNELYPQVDRRRAVPIRITPAKTLHSSLPSQSYFFGREKDLAVIAEAISPEARTWGALIDGPGGIGKTALAIRAAHMAPAEHFDRKIFLSGKVRDLTPAGEQKLEDFMLPNYIALLTELARELGQGNIAQIDPNERANTVRRALAEVRALVVIDNVETFPESERVRLYQFLSRLPGTCKTIVTSRRRADIDARVVRLDRLEHKDALDLMDELARSNRYLQRSTDIERDDLYEITNGNPLLIKWIVWQLGREGSQCRTIADAHSFLKSIPPSANNDPLEYIFGDLLGTFSQSETAVLAALAHFTLPAEVAWVADVAGIVEKAALTALEDLNDRALLQRNDATQTFVLPSLAAAFLRRKCPDIITQTGDRLTDDVHALVLENGWQNYERFAVLEAQWPKIAAALTLFQRGTTDRDNIRLHLVCDALKDFLDFSGRWDEWLTLSQQAEEKAVASDDLYNAGCRAYDAGWIHYLRGQAPEVLACAGRSFDFWERDGAPNTLAAIRLRGIGHELEGNYPAATEAYQAVLAGERAVAEESANVSLLLNDLASIKSNEGDYVGGERDYREGLRIAQKVHFLEGVAIITGNLAETAIASEDWEAAEVLAREALDWSEKVGRQELIGSDCMRLARALANKNRLQEGLLYARRALDIFTRLRMQREIEYAQANLMLWGG